MKSIWSEVAALVARGRHPVVRLPRACEVVEPAHPRGRPRLYAVDARRGRETGYRQTTPCGWPMRGRRRGCQRTLKKNATSICCSETCERELRHSVWTSSTYSMGGSRLDIWRLATAIATALGFVGSNP